MASGGVPGKSGGLPVIALSGNATCALTWGRLHLQ